MENISHFHHPSCQGVLSEYGEHFFEFIREKNYKHIDIDWIRNACIHMEKIHRGRNRANGDPYHIHPYEVARIYCDFHSENISSIGIIAALLHDNIEDALKTGYTENYSTLAELFWPQAAFIVELLSKPSAEIYGNDKGKRNTEYFKNFIDFHSLRDYIIWKAQEKWWRIGNGIEKTDFEQWIVSMTTIRSIAYQVALIKICDRIHNLQTMEDFPLKKIEEKREETLQYLYKLVQALDESHHAWNTNIHWNMRISIMRLLQESLTTVDRMITSKRISSIIF